MTIRIKTCPGCSAEFSLIDFLHNPAIQAIGMQFEDTNFERNMYYFNHECPNCGSTFVVPVLVFLPLLKEPVPEEVLAGRQRCEGHCMRVEDLETCSAPCLYAPFRRFLLALRNRTLALAEDSGEAAA